VSIYIIPNPTASSAEQATALRQAMAERSAITLRETERPEQAREFAAEAVQGSGRKNPFSWEKGKSRLVDGEELTYSGLQMFAA
jgi:hypothetical protein